MSMEARKTGPARANPTRSAPPAGGSAEGPGPRGVTPTGTAGAESGPWTVRALLRWIQTHLEERSVESPRLCAEILISHVLGCDRLRLYMDPDRVPSDEERSTLRALVIRVGKHEPVQYVVGQWPFRGRDFEVAPATLIPRPATETLIDRAITWYRSTMPGQPLRMADIGTGTGIIAISIIAELRSSLRRTGCAPLGGARAAVPPSDSLPVIQLNDAEEPRTRFHTTSAGGENQSDPASPSLRCLATDVVPEAVQLAKRNVARHGLTQAIDVRLGSLFEPFRNSRPQSFDLLCANPPYVTDAEWEEVAANVRDYEPVSALRGGRDGLDIIRPLIADAPHWLRPGGRLLVEIGYRQGPSVLELVQDRSRWSKSEIVNDFEDLPRVLVAERA